MSMMTPTPEHADPAQEELEPLTFGRAREIILSDASLDNLLSSTVAYGATAVALLIAAKGGQLRRTLLCGAALSGIMATFHMSELYARLRKAALEDAKRLDERRERRRFPR